MDGAMIPLPSSIEEYYDDVTISVDVLHVNQIPMLTSISRHIHYGTACALPNTKLDTLEQAIRGIIKSYHFRGLTIKYILVDMQFEALEQRLVKDQVRINVASRQEYASDVEQCIRVIKECAWSYYSMLPFNRIPKRKWWLHWCAQWCILHQRISLAKWCVQYP